MLGRFETNELAATDGVTAWRVDWLQSINVRLANNAWLWRLIDVVFQPYDPIRCVCHQVPKLRVRQERARSAQCANDSRLAGPDLPQARRDHRGRRAREPRHCQRIFAAGQRLRRAASGVVTMAQAIVVGGGIIGLSSAIQLRRRGFDVVLLEANTVGSGASAGNAGWIVPALSAPVASPGAIGYGLHHLLQRSGGFSIRPVPSPAMIGWAARFALSTRRRSFTEGLDATARFAAGAARSFADLTASGLETSVRTSGMLIVHEDPASAAADLRAYRSLHRHGIAVADDLLDGADLTRLEPALGRAARAGIWFPTQQYVDPLHLSRDLAALAVREGVLIRERTTVSRLSEPLDPRVHLDDGESLGNATVVIAAGTASVSLARDLGYRLPMQPGKGYSVTVLPITPLSVPVYIPYAKAALTPLSSGLRVAGVMELGAKSLDVAAARLSRMTSQSQRFFAEDFRHGSGRSDQWAGLRPVTADSLPVIGAVPGTQRAFIASGHAMLGVTLGPLTGEVIAAQASGEPQPLAQPFRPERFLLAGRA